MSSRGKAIMGWFKKRLSTKGVLWFFLTLFWVNACSVSDRAAPSSMERNSLMEALASYQIIGEGTDFLTLKCDMTGPLPPGLRIYALVLDEDGRSLQKVTGYTHKPRLKGRDHLWFDLFLYDPAKAFGSTQTSANVKFIVKEDRGGGTEKIAALRKNWGAKDGARISDLPSPPEQIPGYLILKDYTFYAKGDLREPTGYYVEGYVTGGNGEWTHFVPQSNILGRDENEPGDFLAVDEGWLELRTGRMHSMKEAVSPIGPYVEGFWDGKGYFHPRPLEIRGF